MLHLEPSPAEPDTILDALRLIASRRTEDEMSDSEYFNATLYEDRDAMIREARAALAGASQ